VTREHKLALIVGFSLFLVLGVLISDHFSKARQVELAENIQPSTPQQMGGNVPNGLLPGRGPATVAPGTSLPGTTTRRDLVDLPRSGGTIIPLPVPPAAPGTQLAMGGGRGTPPTLVDVNGHDPRGALAPHLEEGATTHTGDAPAAQPQIPVQKYEVKEGDTLYRITMKYYNDPKLSDKLRDYNKLGGTIREGATIVIPPKDVLLGKPYVSGTSTAPAGLTTDTASNKPDAKSADGFREYVVKSGDTLMGIARKMLSNEQRYTEIEEANPGVDSSSMKIGQKLKIPAK
jgi:LysM repeat protein